MCSSSSSPQDNTKCPGLILSTPFLSVQKTNKQSKQATNQPTNQKQTTTVPILGKEEKK